MEYENHDVEASRRMNRIADEKRARMLDMMASGNGREGVGKPFGVGAEDYRRSAMLYFNRDRTVTLALRGPGGSSYAAGRFDARMWNNIADHLGCSMNSRIVARGLTPGSWARKPGWVHLHMQFGRELAVWAYVLNALGLSERPAAIRALCKLTPADLAFVYSLMDGTSEWLGATPTMIVQEALNRADGIRVEDRAGEIKGKVPGAVVANAPRAAWPMAA
jgi:hypothetical protein